MFVAFVGSSCTRIYIPTNEYKAFVSYLLKLSRTCCQRNSVPANQANFGYPRTLTPTNKLKNDSTVIIKENYIVLAINDI